MPSLPEGCGAAVAVEKRLGRTLVIRDNACGESRCLGVGDRHGGGERVDDVHRHARDIVRVVRPFVAERGAGCVHERFEHPGAQQREFVEALVSG